MFGRLRVDIVMSEVSKAFAVGSDKRVLSVDGPQMPFVGGVQSGRQDALSLGPRPGSRSGPPAGVTKLGASAVGKSSRVRRKEKTSGEEDELSLIHI